MSEAEINMTYNAQVVRFNALEVNAPAGPTISIDLPTNSTYFTANQSLNVSVSAGGGTEDKRWYKLNSASNVSFTSNTTFIAQSGTNTLIACVNNSAGNVSCSSVNFTADLPLLVLSLLHPGNATYNESTIYLAVSANATLDAAQYELDFGSNVTITPTWCYQETANQSTSCGALSTGVYGDNTSNVFYVNYTKPFGAQSSSLWNIRIGEGDTTPGNHGVNITLPQSCWDRGPLLVYKIESNISGNTGLAVAYCQNLTNWVNVTAPNTLSQFGSTGIESSYFLTMDGDWNTAAASSGGVWYPSPTGGFRRAAVSEEGMWWNTT